MSIDTTLPSAPTETRKFHFGLNVADIDRAVAFYRILFGVEPAKHFTDHAKFEVDDPPLILSLHPSSRAAGGALNHVGFRVASSEKLVAVQHRLEMAGIRTEREEGVRMLLRPANEVLGSRRRQEPVGDLHARGRS